MIAHAISCTTWFLLHLLVAGVWRPALVARLEEAGFRLLFSLLSTISLAAMIATYLRAPEVWVWGPSPTLNAVAVVIMLPAFILMVTALSPSNPTLAGVDVMLRDRLPDVGITRVTRHPMLWAFTLWGVAHILANGDVATLWLAGAVLLTAVNGMFSIDRKKRRRLGEAYAAFEAKTSVIPFVAILQGRNTFSAREIGWRSLIISIGLYAAAFWLHSRIGTPIVL